MSAILDCMRKRKIPITQQNYVEIAFLGEKTIDDLGPEELAERCEISSPQNGNAAAQPS